METQAKKKYILDRIVETGGCWIWQQMLDKDGYGIGKFFYKTLRAHRLSYEAFVGVIPRALQLDHLCRVRSCVNPTHLEPVSKKENLERRPKQTHCKRGHEYTPVTVYMNPKNGSKACRICRRIRLEAQVQIGKPTA